MKKRLYFISTVLLAVTALSLSSCLKDPRYVDFSKAGNVVDFPLSGQSYFGADAITDAPADDANGTIVRQFAVNVATANPTTADTKITLAVDNAIVATYNALGGPVQYEEMPTDAYSFTATTVTVPAGKQSAVVSVTFYKNLLDPSKSYMLPIKIVGSPGYTVSGNFGIHYYHLIGNDFAGAWTQNFQRYNASDSTGALNGASFTAQPATFAPITPNEFQVGTGYAGGVYVYDVTFTKTIVSGVAMYSDFAVSFTDSSIGDGTAGGITLTQPPVFLNPPFSTAGPLTFAQATKIFHFQFKAHTTADRYLIDTFYRP